MVQNAAPELDLRDRRHDRRDARNAALHPGRIGFERLRIGGGVPLRQSALGYPRSARFSDPARRNDPAVAYRQNQIFQIFEFCAILDRWSSWARMWSKTILPTTPATEGSKLQDRNTMPG